MEVANELIIRGIVVGVFQENCWVIGNRQTGEAICIDPGYQPDEVLALARDMGVTIKLIANSHAHVDHILGVAGVHRETNAKFLLHEDDLDLLRTGWQSSAERFGFPGGNLDQEMASICNKLLALPDDTTVLPGHMEQTTVGFERQNNPFVADWLRKQPGT